MRATATSLVRPEPDYLYHLVNRSGVNYSQWRAESQERAQNTLHDLPGCTIYQDGAFGFTDDTALAEAERRLHAAGWGGRFHYQGANPARPSEYTILSYFYYGGLGCRWTITKVRWNENSRGWRSLSRSYRTSKDMDGLWEEDDRGDYRQTHGTCQFTLPADEDEARRIICLRYNAKIEDGDGAE